MRSFRNVFFEKVFFEGAILKFCSLENALWEQFWKGINFLKEVGILKIYFLGSNFENLFFQGAILKMDFLREQFSECFFIEEAIYQRFLRELHCWLIGSYFLSKYNTSLIIYLTCKTFSHKLKNPCFWQV